MDFPYVNPADIGGFLFVLVRVGSILLFMPLFGSGMVPVRVKTGLILLLSVAIFPLAQKHPFPQVRNMYDLATMMVFEVAIGYAISYAVRLIFSAVQLAGTLVDFQMGFGIVNVIDPQTNSQVSINAQLLNIMALLLFLAVDAHHYIILAMVDSFSLINPQHPSFTGLTLEYALDLFKAMFITAIKLAAPVMAALFFLSIGLGLVARTVPQMNVFVLGFPLQIAVGLIVFSMTMAFFSQVLQDQFHLLPHTFQNMMRSF
jgi:flagellar biosynthetic protein FliR